MRSVGLALLTAPWLAWGMLAFFAHTSPRVRRAFIGAGALVLVVGVAFLGAGVRILDERVEVIALSIGGALVFFPFLFVAAIRNKFVRYSALALLAAISAFTSACGGVFLILRIGGGSFALDDSHCALVEVLYGGDGGSYDLVVERRLGWCPLLGVECARGDVRPDAMGGRDLRVVLVQDSGHPAASLRAGERELLRVPFE